MYLVLFNNQRCEKNVYKKIIKKFFYKQIYSMLIVCCFFRLAFKWSFSSDTFELFTLSSCFNYIHQCDACLIGF